MNLVLTQRQFPETFVVELPLSKSIVARQLLILYLSRTPLEPATEALGEFLLPHDIVVMLEAIKALEKRRIGEGREAEIITLDCSQSATAMRMLTIVALYEESPTILRADTQLYHRVSQDNLDFIATLGGAYQWDNEQKSLLITPAKEKPHGEITPDWATSQYASAIELCNHFYPQHQIHYHLPTHFPSRSYISLTQNCLKQYQERGHVMWERDWSAATFWYQLCASASEIKQIIFPGLHYRSAQPDAHIAQIYRRLGIETKGDEEKIVLTRCQQPHLKRFIGNLSQNPDLFLSLALTLIKLQIPIDISGVETLHRKESDRIAVFLEQVSKYGITGLQLANGHITWDGSHSAMPQEVTIESYDDHRVAMAFGVFGSTIKGVTTHLLGSQAINKSYPDFFIQLLREL